MAGNLPQLCLSVIMPVRKCQWLNLKSIIKQQIKKPFMVIKF